MKKKATGNHLRQSVRTKDSQTEVYRNQNTKSTRTVDTQKCVHAPRKNFFLG